MSPAGPKITSKNLTYDTTLPPFLARLRGQRQQYSEEGPDPILAARRRPQGKPRSASEEAEDAPVVVDERGNVVQLRDGAIVDDNGDAGVGQKEGGAEVEKADGDTAQKREKKEEEARKRDAEKVAGIGAGRKRKVGRVVAGAGSGSGGEEERGDNDDLSKKKSARADDADSKAMLTATALKKKKAKKIKLSFGDDGE
ncbi:hypothetical protein DL767_002821 [Monosporascus sp. MG133]|nr:hypothetical protein DL767_002821 [Monosporascus sp. MG133]